MYSVMPMLAFATEISGLRVSPMVIANEYRHPVLLAKDAATVDILSGGRFELGIGTGWIKAQYESAGFAYDSGATRLDRLGQAIAAIKGCWGGEPFPFAGAHYRVHLVGSPVPVQQPHPPLLIGGSGTRMLRLAGRETDIVGITATSGQSRFDGFQRAVATSGDRIADQMRWIREGAGNRFPNLELSLTIHLLIADPDSDDGVEAFAAGTGVKREQILSSSHVLVGPTERMTDDLLDLRLASGSRTRCSGVPNSTTWHLWSSDCRAPDRRAPPRHELSHHAPTGLEPVGAILGAWRRRSPTPTLSRSSACPPGRRRTRPFLPIPSIEKRRSKWHGEPSERRCAGSL